MATEIQKTKRASLGAFVGALVLATAALAPAQTLPTGMTATPIYDTTKAGLSFRKDQLPVVGMWEVPGKPKHFVLVGYWGFIWTLYPDTTGVTRDTVMPYGKVLKYKRTQIADFNTWVMKGWEFGALGGAFDPNFKQNRYFYVIYNKYPQASQYRAGFNGTTGGSTQTDGPANATAIVVVDRYIMSPDYQTAVRDTEIVRLFHGSGYGSSNMLFGNDGMLYITTDAYGSASWDSTITARKILRINVTTADPARACTPGATPSNTTLPCGLYSIPSDNPWYNVPNPLVRKEVYAFGFRNTYSLSFNYLTGNLYGAETGQSQWEEINHILPGRNYGWNAGGDGSGNGDGAEGPCHIGASLDSTSAAGAFSTTGSYRIPWSRVITGTSYAGTYTCANFQNPAWYHAQVTGGRDGLPNSSDQHSANVGNISPVFRGKTTSPFYGYMFISDINGMRFMAVKQHRVTPQLVGQFPTSYSRAGTDNTHNGITTWGEDSYGNLYPILLSSRQTGPQQWHDIFMLQHDSLTPLDVPRSQVVPLPVAVQAYQARHGGVSGAFAMAGMELKIPAGYSAVTVHNVAGREVWSWRGKEGFVRLPDNLGKGVLQVRYLP